LKLFISIPGIPLIFAPPGHRCVSIVFRAVLAQVMFHRESRPRGQPSSAEMK